MAVFLRILYVGVKCNEVITNVTVVYVYENSKTTYVSRHSGFKGTQKHANDTCS